MINLINADCLKYLPEIPDNSVDCVITSPPYNFDMKYETYQDKIKWEEYIDWMGKIFSEIYRVLKVGARLCLNVQPSFNAYFPTHHLLTPQAIKYGLRWYAEFCWDKNNYNCAYTCWGSWKSPSMPIIKTVYEFIEVFYKGEKRHTGDKDKADISAEEFKLYTTNRWIFAPENKMHEYGHPAMFPEELPYRLMRLFTYKYDTVLDPFMGTGTTGVVCKKFDRNFIGIELDEKYYNIAKERIDNTKVVRKLF